MSKPNSNPRTQPGETYTLTVSEREFATVLAALRLWQHTLGPYSDFFYRFDQLTNVEIDALAERLNFE